MSRRAKREIAQVRKHRANTRVAERWAAQRMAVDLSEREAEIERLHAVLKDLFMLALVSQDILSDAPQMRAAGKILATYEQQEDRK